MFNKLRNNRGFTLIEMLIVLMVIAVLIILIVPNLSNRSSDINDTGCKALISLVQAQLDAYYIDGGVENPSIEDLVSAGYITEEQKTCPNNDKLVINNGKVQAD